MPSAAFSQRDLRDALSNFATGVTIVTALDAAGAPIGMTASSFNSVSMDPPLILWSITKTALSAQAFVEAAHFGVHILDASQTDMSNTFARSGADKFGDVEFNVSAQGVPQLAGALTRLDCKTWAVYEGGDHWIIVGQVQDLHTEKGVGLVFSQGSYATASQLRPPNPSKDQSGADLGTFDERLVYHLSRAHRQVTQDFYVAVRAEGLSMPEWRVLASLHGRRSAKLDNLSRRTFVGHLPLQDLLLKMQDQGLCKITGEGADMDVSDTKSGRARVAHLLELAKHQEQHAIGDAGREGLSRLIDLLDTVISNTNS